MAKNIKTVTISLIEYRDLLLADSANTSLHDSGVDNWDSYSDAMCMSIREYKQTVEALARKGKFDDEVIAYLREAIEEDEEDEDDE